jgi:RNA recognition motif-containing protein
VELLFAAGMAYTLFVRPLSHLSNEFIRRTFSEFGEVVDVHIPRTFGSKKRQSYGYVKYDDKHAAARAIDALNDKTLNGHVLSVVWADQSAKTPEEMAEKRRQRREEREKSGDYATREPRELREPAERREIPLREQFFTAVDYPPGIGEEFTPLYQKNLPPVGQRRQFFSWVYVGPDVREKILRDELEKQAYLDQKRRSAGDL